MVGGILRRARRLPRAVVVAALVASILAPTFSVGAADASVVITPTVTSVSPGQSFAVEVAITTDTPTRALQLGLSFDPTLVEANAVRQGSFYKDWAASHGAQVTTFPSPTIDNATGRISPFSVLLIGGQEGGPTGAGVVCRFEMTAKAGVSGQSALTLTDVVVSDASAREIPAAAVDGRVVVGQATPTRTFTPTAVPFTATVAPQPTATSIRTPIPPDQCPNWDVNCDGRIDVNDLVAIGSHWKEAGSPGWIRADINDDGVIDVLDEVIVGDHLCGESSTDPSCDPTPTVTRTGISRTTPSRTPTLSAIPTATRTSSATATPTKTPTPTAAPTSTPAPATITATPTVTSSPTNGGVLLSFSPDHSVAQPGESFYVDVMIDATVPVRGAQLGLTFDPSRLTLESVAEGQFLKDWADANGQSTLLFPAPVPDNTAGTVAPFSVIAVGGSGGATGVGAICRLNFTAKAVASSTSSIVLTDVVVSDPQSSPLPATVGSGIVEVTSNATPATSTPTPTPTPTKTPGTPTLTPTPTRTLVVAPTNTPTPTPEQVNANVSLGFAPSTQTVSPGQTFAADVVISTDTAVRGIQVGVSYDPSLVEVTSVTQGTFLKSWATANGSTTTMMPAPSPNNTTGVISPFSTIIVGGTGGPTGSGTVCTLNMKAKTGASGTAALSLFEVVVSDVASHGLTSTLGGGTVAVGSVGTPTVTPTATATAGTQSPSPTQGSPTATSTPSPTPPPTATVPSGNVSLSFSPASQTVSPGQEFTVDITITTDTPVRGIQSGFTFNPSVVEVTGWNPGSFLQDWADANGQSTTVFPEPTWDNGAGTVSALSIMLTGGTGGPTGSGSVATFNMKVKTGASGQSTLTLTDSMVSAAMAEAYQDPVALEHARSDGQVTVGAAQATNTPTSTATATPTRTASPTSTSTGAATSTPTRTQVVVPTNTATPTWVANGTATVKISPSTQSIDPGQTFTVNVDVNTVDATRGIQLGLSFDPSLVQVEEVVEGTFYKSWASSHGQSTTIAPRPSINNSAGKVSTFSILVVGTTSTEGPTGSGLVCSFKMKAKDGASGTSALTLLDIAISTPDGQNEIPSTMTSGQINVAQGGSATSTALATRTVTASTTVVAGATRTAGTTVVGAQTVSKPGGTPVPGKTGSTGNAPAAASKPGQSGATGAPGTNGSSGNTAAGDSSAVPGESADGTRSGASTTSGANLDGGSRGAPLAPSKMDLSKRTDGAGVLKEDVQHTGLNGIVTLRMKKGTKALGGDGRPLTAIEVTPGERNPGDERDALSHLIDLKPNGATFDPPISITLAYDNNLMGDGLTENDISLAYFNPDGGQWSELESSVDPEGRTVTASVSHFTLFAVVSKSMPGVRWGLMLAIWATEAGVGYGTYSYIHRRRAPSEDEEFEAESELGEESFDEFFHRFSATYTANGRKSNGHGSRWSGENEYVDAEQLREAPAVICLPAPSGAPERESASETGNEGEE